jgi:hypothetical protein
MLSKEQAACGSSDAVRAILHCGRLMHACAGHQQPVDGPETPVGEVKLASKDLVHGYVRSAQATGKGSGLFVSLSASQTARVKLRMMADEYVDDPVAAFPVGKHVRGRVLDVSHGRIELSIKSTQLDIGGWRTISSLTEGQVHSM